MGGVISSLEKSVTRLLPKKKPNPRRLLKAADSGDADSVYRKIARGYDPNSRDKKTLETPLHRAASKGHLDVIHVLLSRNVEVDVTDKVNRTPLHFAAQNGHAEAIELLLQEGSASCKVSVNGEDQDGQTPLHLAAAGGHVEAVTKLLQCGAIRDIRDKDGKTPADVAQSSEVRQLLGEAGSATTTVSQPLAEDPTNVTIATSYDKPAPTQLDTRATYEPMQPVVVSEAPANVTMPVIKSSDGSVRDHRSSIHPSIHPSIATKIPVTESPVSNTHSHVGLPELGTAELTPPEAAAAAVIAVEQASGVHSSPLISETMTHVQPVAPSIDAMELKPTSAPAPVSLVAELPSAVQPPVASLAPSIDAAELKPISAPAPVSLVAELPNAVQPVASLAPSINAADTGAGLLKPISEPAPVSLVAELPSAVQYSEESFPMQQAIAPKVEAERVPVKPPMFETRPAAPAKSSNGPDPLDDGYTTSVVTTTF